MIGPNGAGKTTLLDVISGKVQPTAGRVIFGKHTDLVGLPRERDRRARHRAEVPDAVHLRQPDRAGEPRAVAAPGPSKGVLATLRARLDGDAARAHRGDARDHRARRPGGRSGRAGSPTARSSGSRSAWSSCRTPSSCWSTSRWPGMTDEETEKHRRAPAGDRARSGRCSSSSTTWSSCGSIARTVTVLHEGSVLCEGPVDQVQQDERVLEVYLGRSRTMRGGPCLRCAASTSPTARARCCGTSRSTCPAGGVVCLMGRNGVGKTTLLKIDHGPPAGALGARHVRRRRPRRPAAGGAGRVRDRLRAAGPRDLPEPHRAGEPARGHARPRRAGGQRPRRRRSSTSSSSSRSSRQLLGRKGGVLSGGEQQQLAIARVLLARPKLLLHGRADRGHPAVGHPPDRGRHRADQGAAASRCSWSSSTSSSPGAWPAPTRSCARAPSSSSGATADLRDDMVRQHLTV